MTLAGLSHIDRFLDRVFPALFVGLGLTLSAAFVAVAG
jgi:hypothetical protein